MRRFPLMVFAAGFGTRMGALTADRPKPLVPVAGRALIDRTLDLVPDAGCSQVIVNLHYRGDMLADWLKGRDVTLSWEHDQILETGGGLKAALPLLGLGPIMCLNSDAIWRGPNPLAMLAEAWEDHIGALLLVGRTEQLDGRGSPAADFRMAPDGRLTRAGGASEGVVFLGAQIIRQEPVAAWPERVFSLNRIWDRLIAEGRLFGLTYPGRWCDVGSPAGLAAAEAMLAGQADG